MFRINFFSNLVFNLLLLLSTAVFGIPHLTYAAAGEVIVIWAEYAIYCRLLTYGKTRLLAFATAANLASLCLGIGLDCLLSDMGYWYV